MADRVRELARRRLAEMRGEPPPAERKLEPLTEEDLDAMLPPGALEKLTPEARRKLLRWAQLRREGKAPPIRVGPGRRSKRVPRRDLPLCGAPTAPWSKCPSCRSSKARAGRTCKECGHVQPPGPPCKARVARDEHGQPRKRCRRHGGLLRGPTTPEGRARANMNLRRGREPGPAQRPVGAESEDA